MEYTITSEFKMGNLHKFFCKINDSRYLVSNNGQENYYEIFFINSLGELWFEVYGKSIEDCFKKLNKKLKAV